MSDTIELQPKSSLFQINSELAGLITLRSEMLDTGEDTSAVDGQIKLYLSDKLPAKVDGVRGYIRSLQAAIVAAKEEKSRISAHLKSKETELEWLQDYVKDAMAVIGEKKLEGRTGSLSLRNAGGVQALTVSHIGLLPESMVRYQGIVSPGVYKLITDHTWNDGDVELYRVPNNEAIRAELQKPCGKCGGTGEVCPAGPSDAPMNICPECNGTKTKRVPGARLEPRSQSLVVK